ncbi:hypothetical protein GOODEAATRI_013558, partial [Goodea atripinnis]
RSGDFSQYQLAGLLQRNRLNQRLEGVEKEMSQRSAGSAPHLGQQDGDQQYRSVESNRLVSEDHSHYILIKESQPGSAPWSGSSQSTCRKRKADKPEPLWRPVTEEEQEEAKEEVPATCSEASNPSVSKPSRQDTSPPSPRTLKAIQAAMSDSSEEEKVDLDTKYGKVSPRTLLAIQQALTEEEGEASGSPFKLQTNLQRPAGRVVISSSEKETQPSPEKKLDVSQNATHQSLHIEDSLLGSSSEDELEEVIGQRNRAFRSAGLRQSPKTGMESEEGSVRDAEIQKELEARESEPKPHVSASNQELFISLPSLPCGRPASTETEAEHGLLDKRRDTPTEGLGETNGDDVKTENSEGSDSEGKVRINFRPSCLFCQFNLKCLFFTESFIEVSEEEFKQGDAGDPAGGKRILEEVQKDESKKEEESEERWTEVPDNPALVSDKEEEKTGSKNQEEEDELEALESSLQLEQSNLMEQKQQQERMANTVTGQMYLESQELLRLFGVPFLVAPMEAEAQCAALDRADQTHGTITDDSDVWLFGGRHVYKNFFSQNKYVEHYQYSDLQSQLGVGYVTGMEILNEFPGPGLEPLTQLRFEKKRLTDDPRDTKTQLRIDSFFRLEQQEKQAIRSDVAVDAELAKAIMSRRFHPSAISPETWEGYIFSDLEIRIKESTDLYGAVLWPSAMVLGHFLETNQDKFNLAHKNVIELGAGTGLVTELIWGQNVAEHFPCATHHFDYILAADVVYAHPYLNELMDTIDYLCHDSTQILWAMRFRLDPENSFVDRFQQHFHLEELYDLPSLSIKLYRAWRKDKRTKDHKEATA